MLLQMNMQLCALVAIVTNPKFEHVGGVMLCLLQKQMSIPIIIKVFQQISFVVP